MSRLDSKHQVNLLHNRDNKSQNTSTSRGAHVIITSRSGVRSSSDESSTQSAGVVLCSASVNKFFNDHEGQWYVSFPSSGFSLDELANALPLDRARELGDRLCFKVC